ncbi:PLP-dependent aminotransferase family protein [Agarilytica rhodophyticola]|uniref:aminotransferase-like domain-containing protein n=1 Tax=Agarilytica rhodophyticola TaxID=1737490 RepID=UPI000B347D55|nr:PLP-dependent aminotransferase family protein [Agarilytica rhodophyticola]
MKLYLSLAEHYIDDIKVGRLPPGARLPALRRVASQHNISMTTAVKAYQHLEQRGWIVSQPQAGFFVAKGATTNASDQNPDIPSFTAHTSDPSACAPVAGYNPNSGFFSPLGTSMLSPALLPTQELQLSIKRAARRAGNDLHYYPEPQGSQSLRLALQQHFRKYDFAFSDSDLVVTHGCLQGIRIAVDTVSKEGDTLAVSSPCFSGLLDLLSNMSRKIIEIPSSRDGLDLAQLERHMKRKNMTAGLFSTSHVNPLGISLKPEQKQQLAALASKYQIPIIEDDVYLEMGYDKKPPLATKYWDKSGHIIWCGSISKTLAAGVRLGWCLPGRYLNEYITRHRNTSYGVNTLIQMSMADFINSGQYMHHLNRMRIKLQQQSYQYQRYLRDNLPPYTKVSDPSGGLVLWVQIPGLDAEALTERARHEKIDIRSGLSFSTQNYYRDYFRINFGWSLEAHDKQGNLLETEAFQQLKRVCELANELCKVSRP